MDTFRQDLINRIYEAALDPALWQPLLQQIGRLVDAKECVIVFQDRLDRTRNAVFAANSSSDTASVFLQDFIDSEMACLRPLLEQQPDGVPLTAEELAGSGDSRSYEELLGEAREFHQRLDIEVQCGVRLLQTPHLTAALGIHREIDSAPLSPAATALIEELGPHLARAIRIYDTLSSACNQNSRLTEALERCGAGVLLLDRELRVIFSNSEALRVLDEHPAINIGKGGRLRTARGDEQRRLDTLLQQLGEQRLVTDVDSRATEGISLALHHERRVHPLKVTVLPLTGLEATPALSQERIRVAVFLSDPERSWSVPQEYLTQAYRLTPTEIVVAQSLLNGASIADISTQRCTSEETTRWQVKQILKKTQTGSQAELVRLLAALSVNFRFPVD